MVLDGGTQVDGISEWRPDARPSFRFCFSRAARRAVMNQLSFTWIELCIAMLLFGGLGVSRVRNADAARRWAMLFSGLALLLMCGMYIDFRHIDFGEASVWQAHDLWDVLGDAFGPG